MLEMQAMWLWPPGEGNGNPLQYSCLENSMDRGVWWATVHGVTKSQTQLSTRTHLHTHTHCSHHVQARAVSSLQAVCSPHKSKSKSRTIACSLLQNTWTVLFMSFIINFSLGYDSHFLCICMSINFYWILNIMNLTFLKAGFCFILLRSVEFSGK